MGRKFSRASSARVDREGSFELQGCLAEAWLVKEAAAILLASWIPDGRSPLKSVNLHTWLHALSHQSTTCVIRIQSIQTWMADERAASDRSFAAVASQVHTKRIRAWGRSPFL